MLCCYPLRAAAFSFGLFSTLVDRFGIFLRHVDCFSADYMALHLRKDYSSYEVEICVRETVEVALSDSLGL
jgi:hypothetical protein